MRLLNADTLEFHEFFDSIPPYVILSHRWGENEVSYQMFLKRNKEKNRTWLEHSAGYTKILDFCKHAPEITQQEYDVLGRISWVWIDTCCIDKSSSAELSEAINSMFAWYRDAQVCYVYLADVTKAEATNAGGRGSFQASEWFTRGWTLQELLASWFVEFLDVDWQLLGNKDNLVKQISEVTGIDEYYLSNPYLIYRASVATRFSWASRRKTSRVEDMAYCLLGLFDINMPLLYGEGMKAFRRLQEEIIRTSSDESVFAWTQPHRNDSSRTTMLARSPADFANSQHIRGGLPPQFDHDGPWKHVKPYQITNFGLQMTVNYIRVPGSPRIFYVPLRAHEVQGEFPFFMALVNVHILEDMPSGDQYERLNTTQKLIMEDLPHDFIDDLKRGRWALETKTLFIAL